jgi:hypothetical protein
MTCGVGRISGSRSLLARPEPWPGKPVLAQRGEEVGEEAPGTDPGGRARVAVVNDDVNVEGRRDAGVEAVREMAEFARAELMDAIKGLDPQSVQKLATVFDQRMAAAN